MPEQADGTNNYKLLVGIDTSNGLGVNDYEALEKASSADNTDKWFVIDNIYTSGAKGDRKTIDLTKLIGKNVTDLSYKTVYLFLYTTGSSAAVEEGKYDRLSASTIYRLHTGNLPGFLPR